MFRIGIALFSRPQRQHFRKKIPGFYAPYLGASFMKRYPVIPYRRLNESLFHYPEESKVDGKPINWRYGTPKSGYEQMAVFGENTIEIKGLPMLKTPEYMQERLRRFFSKFGRVTMCRAINHPLDPYQCEGTAYVSFREFESCETAAKSVLRLGTRDMGYKVLTMRVMKTDELFDGRTQIAERQGEIDGIMVSTRRLYQALTGDSEAEVTATTLPLSSPEVDGIQSRFGSVEEYLKRVKSLFILSPDGAVVARRLVDADTELETFRRSLEHDLEESLSVHWRINAPIKELPEYTKRQIRLWDKKDPLPFDLQILSRDMRQYRVHDEKFLVEARKKRERAWNRAENRKAAIAKRKGASVPESIESA